MHINHRRKNKFRGKHHGYHMIYSMKEMRQEFWGKARAQVRHLIAHERYDDLPTRYPNCIIYDFL